MKNIVYVLLWGVMFLVYSCGSSEDSSSEEELKETPEKVEIWTYSETTDEMDNSKNRYASTTSTNTLNFEFPYGETDFELVIREKKNSTDVYMTCSSCQFLTGIMDEKTYRFKFDEEPPVKFSVSSASSGGADIVFFNSEKKLISKIKKAKRLKIEAEFYDSGFKTIDFNIEGLKW